MEKSPKNAVVMVPLLFRILKLNVSSVIEITSIHITLTREDEDVGLQSHRCPTQSKVIQD